MANEIKPAPIKELGGYPSTENWQKTLGDHTIYGTSDVVVNGNQITMKIKVHCAIGRRLRAMIFPPWRSVPEWVVDQLSRAVRAW